MHGENVKEIHSVMVVYWYECMRVAICGLVKVLLSRQADRQTDIWKINVLVGRIVKSGHLRIK